MDLSVTVVVSLKRIILALVIEAGVEEETNLALALVTKLKEATDRAITTTATTANPYRQPKRQGAKTTRPID